MSKAQVICAGIIVVDHVADTIPRLPESGELILTSSCQLHIGGCASNVAINLSKWNVPVAVIGRVGQDALGQFAISTFRQYEIDLDFIHQSSKRATSQTLVINVLGEDRRFIHDRGANDDFAASDVSLDPFPDARILYVGGMFLMNSLSADELAIVFSLARKRKMTTILDVVTPEPKNYETPLRTILPYVDYFLPNEDEAQMITGKKSPEDQSECLARWGASGVVITRGRMGCHYRDHERCLFRDAEQVDFVDGTGGGDAFSAGFITGLLEGLGIEECLDRGSALGASCVRRAGATEGVFSRKEWMESRSPRQRPLPDRA